MGFFELLLIALGLSMDAFAVSICKGLSIRKSSVKACITVGAWFGIFQAAMPLIGYFVGSAFEEYIKNYDHWIAFILLSVIGVNMIFESRKEEENTDASLGIKTMFIMAVATSIDALAVGVTFALLPDVNIFAAVSFIGIITFTLSAAGVKIGNLFGTRFRGGAELTGGIILILIGVKILADHLGLLEFIK